MSLGVEARVPVLRGLAGFAVLGGSVAWVEASLLQNYKPYTVKF
jgi:hypothetical protein